MSIRERLSNGVMTPFYMSVAANTFMSPESAITTFVSLSVPSIIAYRYQKDVPEIALTNLFASAALGTYIGANLPDVSYIQSVSNTDFNTHILSDTIAGAFSYFGIRATGEDKPRSERAPK